MSDEERLSVKLSRKASKCRKDNLTHKILVCSSYLVYDLGKFNHTLAHALGYPGTGFKLLASKRPGFSIPVEGEQLND